MYNSDRQTEQQTESGQTVHRACTDSPAQPLQYTSGAMRTASKLSDKFDSGR